MVIDNNTIILIAILAVALVVAAFKVAPYFKNGSNKYLSSLAILNLTGEIYIEVSKLFKDLNSIDVDKYKSDSEYRKEIVNKSMDTAYGIIKQHGYDLEKDAPVITMIATQAVEKLIDSITIDKQSDTIKQLEKQNIVEEDSDEE